MDINRIEPLGGYAPSIGTALWSLEDARSRTLEAIAELTDEEVDAVAPGLPNTVGSTLYHLAAIEADWLYYDMLRVDFPAWTQEWFPFDVREEDGRLSPVTGFAAANHRERLALVRRHFLADIKQLDEATFGRSTGVPENPSTPQWALHHLCQHEAEHRGQIQSILTVLRGT